MEVIEKRNELRIYSIPLFYRWLFITIPILLPVLIFSGVGDAENLSFNAKIILTAFILILGLLIYLLFNKIYMRPILLKKVGNELFLNNEKFGKLEKVSLIATSSRTETLQINVNKQGYKISLSINGETTKLGPILSGIYVAKGFGTNKASVSKLYSKYHVEKISNFLGVNPKYK